ncbi:AfsR/SARP family transcriptional regulator [Streptomyces typhae]|uniref:AfsR/SARP family transcriptional regulator n=1 Tax=Streptomyces typhae TaxID=2681492 RepID=UPI001FECE74B|nr:AfsR/SARP family transcriptional regulator [Streptomyces typhae]
MGGPATAAVPLDALQLPLTPAAGPRSGRGARRAHRQGARRVPSHRRPVDGRPAPVPGPGGTGSGRAGRPGRRTRRGTVPAGARAWQAEAFAGRDTPWFNELRDTLARERLAAELDGKDIALRQGRHSELLAPLTARAATYPLDERLAGQLMLALYRAGRAADALAHYRNLREHLAEELGVDPSGSLRDLHQQLLTGDPGAAAPGWRTWPSGAPP